MHKEEIRRRLAAAGACLFLVGMLTGLWVGASITMREGLDYPRLALASHLNALIGGLWLFAVAWSFRFLRYRERGLRRLALLVAVPAWANWLITLCASILDVNGLSFGNGLANDIIAGLLQALVVVPTLVAVTAWAWGFRRPQPARGRLPITLEARVPQQ